MRKVSVGETERGDMWGFVWIVLSVLSHEGHVETTRQRGDRGQGTGQ